MSTLEFTEGDTAEMWVHNNLAEETSLHWHGLFLPNGNEPEAGSVGIRINGNDSTYLSSIEVQSLQ